MPRRRESFDALSRSAAQEVFFAESRRHRKAPNGVRLQLTGMGGGCVSVASVDRETKAVDDGTRVSLGDLSAELGR